MSLEPSSLADIRFNCPVCYTSLFPPVFQCKSGHLVCKSCLSRLTKCGVCRVSLSISNRVRNLEVERIIRIMQHPCPNEDDGCNAMLKFDQVEDHRMECSYTKFPICREILGRGCEEIRICEYAEHYERVHKRKFFDTGRKAFPVIYSNRINIEECPSRNLIFRFRLRAKSTLAIVVIKHDKESGLLKVKPYILAGRALTNQLSCKISFLYGEYVKMMSESPIFNLQTKPEDLQSCFSLSFKHLRTILGAISVNVPGKCKIRIEFSTKDENLPNYTTDSESTMEISTD